MTRVENGNGQKEYTDEELVRQIVGAVLFTRARPDSNRAVEDLDEILDQFLERGTDQQSEQED